MKYYQLYINFENSPETYAAVTQLLEKEPIPKQPSWFNANLYDSWFYQVEVADEDVPFDFITAFLDILEGKYEAIAALGISRSDILFWLVYEYDEQCALEFHPQEMKRLGEKGIVLNIDCRKIKKEDVE